MIAHSVFAKIQQPSKAQKRWLASKAFHQTDAKSQIVPVTALIAICEGARFIESRTGYRVTSDLDSILTRYIHLPKVLGRIRLNDKRTYDGFIAALKMWLIHDEQFEPQKYRIEEICIRTDKETKKLSLHFNYSGPLPPDITDPSIREKPGQICDAWDAVRMFALDKLHDGNQLSLIFEYLQD